MTEHWDCQKNTKFSGRLKVFADTLQKVWRMRPASDIGLRKYSQYVSPRMRGQAPVAGLKSAYQER